MGNKNKTPLNSFSRFDRYYKIFAVILLNACVLFVSLSIILFVIFAIRDYIKQSNPVSEKYNQSLTKVYPGLTEKEINALLNETWSRPLTFEPFVQFKESLYRGKYVNVDKNGFRITKNQGPWPPISDNFNVFLFGGSTTFGYGVSDDQTIASYLQESLSHIGLRRNIRVYNFGQALYYSTQELILFQRLLLLGFIPDTAIFIDGNNEFFYKNDEPVFTNELKEFIAKGHTVPKAVSFLVQKLPITRAINIILRFLHKKRTPRLNEQIYNDKSYITKVIDRYIENKKLIELISDAYGIKSIFVWQPVPPYKYDLRYHLFPSSDDDEVILYEKYGYPFMAEFIKKEPLGRNFLWCADMQEDIKEPLYVDQVHYTAGMSKKFAQLICYLLQKRGFLTTQDVP